VSRGGQDPQPWSDQPAEDSTVDHEWEAPPNHWLTHTNWSPGRCAHRLADRSRPCGVHLLAHPRPVMDPGQAAKEHVDE
jgi:hypothetical protein